MYRLLLAGLLFAAVSDLTNDRSVTASEKISYDRTTLVILAPSGPVIADLQISAGRLPYRQWLVQFLAGKLDQDKSGSLDVKELALLTEPLLSLAGFTDSSKILQLAPEGPQTGAIPIKDFVTHFGKGIKESVFLSAMPGSPDESIRLGVLVDTDHDGLVSADELNRASGTLRFRDLDDDETFSISELLPYRDPRTQQADLTPDTASLPFFEVTDMSSAERAADRILKRYGNEGTVEYSRLRHSIPEAEVAAATEPKAFDRGALSSFLLAPAFHLTITIQLSDKANRSDAAAAIDAAATSFIDVRKDEFGSVLVEIDGMQLAVKARGGGANNRAFARGFLGQSFLMNDQDKNQYLDASEFAGLSGTLRQNGVTADFASIDSDKNGMITREELFAFSDRDSIAASGRIEVTVEQDGRTLFGLVDTNQDRRLTPRELTVAASMLAELDRNGDGMLADTELGTRYQLTVGLGRSELRRNTSTRPLMGGMNQAGNTDAVLPGTAQLTGPEWFRRMDRNQDGDVSRREFPGGDEHFLQIDTDRDERLSEAEAAAAVSSPRFTD